MSKIIFGILVFSITTMGSFSIIEVNHTSGEKLLSLSTPHFQSAFAIDGDSNSGSSGSSGSSGFGGAPPTGPEPGGTFLFLGLVAFLLGTLFVASRFKKGKKAKL